MSVVVLAGLGDPPPGTVLGPTDARPDLAEPPVPLGDRRRGHLPSSGDALPRLVHDGGHEGRGRLRMPEGFHGGRFDLQRAERAVLLILDNCEHLIDACAQLAETLLAECEHVTLLATSREALNIPGEHVYAVAPLNVPRAETATDYITMATDPDLMVATKAAMTPILPKTSVWPSGSARVARCMPISPPPPPRKAARDRYCRRR